MGEKKKLKKKKPRTKKDRVRGRQNGGASATKRLQKTGRETWGRGAPDEQCRPSEVQGGGREKEKKTGGSSRRGGVRKGKIRPISFMIAHSYLWQSLIRRGCGVWRRPGKPRPQTVRLETGVKGRE